MVTILCLKLINNFTQNLYTNAPTCKLWNCSSSIQSNGFLICVTLWSDPTLSPNADMMLQPSCGEMTNSLSPGPTLPMESSIWIKKQNYDIKYFAKSSQSIQNKESKCLNFSLNDTNSCKACNQAKLVRTLHKMRYGDMAPNRFIDVKILKVTFFNYFRALSSFVWSSVFLKFRR